MNYQVKNGSLILIDYDREKLKLKFFQNRSIENLKKIHTYVSAREAMYKCITFDTPMMQGVLIRKVMMKFNTSSYANGKIGPGQFFLYLTYPYQLLRTSMGSRIKLIHKKAVDCYKSEIHVGYMKVLKRRNKRHEPCNPYWKHHDNNQLKSVIKTVGCNPVNWNIESDYQNCLLPHQYLRILEEMNEKDNFMPPCRSIEILTTKQRGNTDWRYCLGQNFLELHVFLDEQSHYEEVNLLPAYTIQSLIGNSGTESILSIIFKITLKPFCQSATYFSLYIY